MIPEIPDPLELLFLTLVERFNKIQRQHPAYYALSLNGVAMLLFGSCLLLLPGILLKSTGYRKKIDPQLIMMHRITGIWVFLAGLASVWIANFESCETVGVRVACGIFAAPHAVEVSSNPNLTPSTGQEDMILKQHEHHL